MEPVQGIINSEEWRKEKLDFICSVVPNVDQDSLLAELGFCETNEDAEGLMQSLILLQDQDLSIQNDIPPNQLPIFNDSCQLHLHNEIIVHLPEEQDEQVIPQPQYEDAEEPDNDNAVSEAQAENSDSEDSCYFTPDIFNSLHTEPEVDELDEIIDNEVDSEEAENVDTEEAENLDSEEAENLDTEEAENFGTEAAENVDKEEAENVDTEEAENADTEENTFAAEIAQAIAESEEMTGAVAQAEAVRSETESKIMSQVSILASLFCDADPDFLQERIEECMKLEGDEERFQEFVEANLELKKYPTMKDYVKRQKQATITQSDSTEDFVIIEDTQVLAENLTVECGICLEENILGIDTSTCSALKNEHTYCNQCIKRYVAAQIGQGLTFFKCMEGYCNAEFSLRMLQKLIDPPVFAKLWERRQQEEIEAAGVENLESCPFCNYMVSMPNEEDKIFQCWNPDCMIDSCRKCKEPSHIPLRCDEIEKKGQLNARTYLENEMAEAMIRECPRCKKRFIIEAGCNRMTCPCGAVMCYVCKKLIETTNGDGYSHFERGPVPSEKCPLYSNAATLHAEEVRGAAERAKHSLDPQVTLVHDPTNGLL